MEKKNFIIKKNIIWSILIILVYKLLLDYIYFNRISEYWNYMGFIKNASSEKYLFSWVILCFFIPLILINLRNTKVDGVIVSILNFISLIPTITMLGFYKSETLMMMLIILYWILLNLCNIFIGSINLKKPKYKIQKIGYRIIVTLSIIVILFVSYKYAGFRIDLNIFNAYEWRTDSRNFNMPIILEYAFSSARNILPIFIAERLYHKKRVQSILLFFVGIIAYSVTGSKSVLFSYILTYIVFYLYDSKFVKKIPWATASLAAFSALELSFNKIFFITDVVLRRVLFVPSLLSYYYYDFFSVNQVDYFKQSFLRLLGYKSSYGIPITFMIGEIYFSGANANAGLFSDAYYNLGSIGVIIMPIFIILLIKIFRGVTNKVNDKIIIASVITITFSLINSSIFTVILTHGFLATIIVLFFIPIDEEIIIK